MNIFDAIRNNDIEAVKEYLENGGDVNAKDNYGNTALMYVKHNEYKEIIELIEKHIKKKTKMINFLKKILNIFKIFKKKKQTSELCLECLNYRENPKTCFKGLPKSINRKKCKYFDMKLFEKERKNEDSNNLY